ncbi:thiol reductant ABC exporter subunit CydD [Paenalkalicoccus suaedae]|uniref:Thiol reductant ABC exporter subunit CydD n=1 Tax=Paenalkalicoccus suaedae TaxID=2592382 RepID=A0A859FBH1_9BACI|nr:thiol reductant ABC exporter subunit CydD [Paenalkalicoccus suaedae]QKS70387.1 thiol reductant ABC exporter subunit CydD [Paenalkalicoccus suaedae]
MAKQLKQLAREDSRNRYTLLFVSMLIGLTIIAQAYFIVAIVDTIFLEQGAVQDVAMLFIGLLVALLLRALLQFVNNITGEKMARKAKRSLREQLVQKYTKNPLQASLKGQSGSKVSVLLDSVDEVDPYFSQYYPIMMQSSLVPLFLLGAILYMDWLSGLILIFTAPFIPVVMAIIGRNTQAKSDEQMEKLNAFSGKFLDVLQGLPTLKLFGQGKKQQQDIEYSSLQYRDTTMSVLKIAFLSSLMLEFISMLSIALVALEVGLRLVIYDSITFFAAFFVLILVPEFFASLKDMSSGFHAGRGGMAAYKRIEAELDQEEQPVTFGQAQRASGAPAISLQNLTFAYDERFTLGPITADINARERIAIVGQTGSGKSTLLAAITGMVPLTDGAVHVNGTPLTDLAEHEWFSGLSYISQRPYLFSGTLRENISMGLGKSEQELLQAVKKAGLEDVVTELSEGLDTKIGEGARALSGGEKQRVALARAFLKKPDFILFDEPTVGLDVKTERILQRSIQELSEGATVITVAHRLHTIKEADRIVYLESGQVTGIGRHEELLHDSPTYQAMFRAHGGDAS